MKKTLSILLALLMIFAVIPVTAAFADDESAEAQTVDALRQKRDEALTKVGVLTESIQSENTRKDVLFKATKAIEEATTEEGINAAVEAAKAEINTQVSYEYQTDNGFFAAILLVLGKILDLLKSFFGF